MTSFEDSRAWAIAMDRKDALAPLRGQFNFPRHRNGRSPVYLCGNSLGLQPREVQQLMDEVRRGVQVHEKFIQPAQEVGPGVAGILFQGVREVVDGAGEVVAFVQQLSPAAVEHVPDEGPARAHDQTAELEPLEALVGHAHAGDVPALAAGLVQEAIGLHHPAPRAGDRGHLRLGARPPGPAHRRSASVRVAARLGAEGIAVYEVRPGVTRTDMTAGVEAKYDDFIAAGGVPQGRWGEPEDVGRAVAALARGDFSYSTGAVIEVSGGMNIKRL